MDLREKVARMLAGHAGWDDGASLEVAFEDYWELVLPERARETYRRRADGVIDLIRREGGGS